MVRAGLGRPPGKHHMNVLIVEDDPGFAVVVKTMVEARGHSAKVCTR
jgi:CheY-like chemotaxis protein